MVPPSSVLKRDGRGEFSQYPTRVWKPVAAEKVSERTSRAVRTRAAEDAFGCREAPERGSSAAMAGTAPSRSKSAGSGRGPGGRGARALLAAEAPEGRGQAAGRGGGSGGRGGQRPRRERGEERRGLEGSAKLWGQAARGRNDRGALARDGTVFPELPGETA